jgi:hypothetical protein
MNTKIVVGKPEGIYQLGVLGSDEIYIKLYLHERDKSRWRLYSSTTGQD